MSVKRDINDAKHTIRQMKEKKKPETVTKMKL